MGALPFALSKPFYPLNTGAQAVVLGAGGPSGFKDGRAGHLQPSPYQTGFFSFVTAFPWGMPRNRAQASNAPNLWAGHAPMQPIGYVKAQTGAGFSF